MAKFFLIIIYLAFISLGLPDSLLGVAWPAMRLDFKAPLEAAGLISMFIAGGTIISSLISGFVLKRLGTGRVTLISCVMTAGALLGFSLAPSFIWLILLAVPLGLGAGSVDAGLNNYVADNYKAHHMSWLHCFWGLGATIGPIIMSWSITNKNSWRNGYTIVGTIQFLLVALLFFSLPLWDRMKSEVDSNPMNSPNEADSSEIVLSQEPHEKKKPMQRKGVKLSLISFLFYCGAETTMGLWGSSFLINVKGLPVATAAQWVSMYYSGITVGRFITGFITMKVCNKTLIRFGQLIALMGALILLTPLPSIFALAGFIMVGLGFAPVFPCMMHETPARFGKDNSQAIIGYQMASAYTGSTFLPPILGLLAARSTIQIFSFFILGYIILMLISSEKINFLYQK
ncbi:MAG: MFS transporter [Bacillota bacterium]|nr:MFS transporter [Bacillota bacterium]